MEFDEETMRQFLDKLAQNQGQQLVTAKTTRIGDSKSARAVGLLWVLAGVVVLVATIAAGYRFMPFAGDLMGRLLPAPATVLNAQPTRVPLPKAGSIRGGTGYATSAVRQQQVAEEAAAPVEVILTEPLNQPMNSEGKSVLRPSQQQQLNQSSALASREWQAAADQQQADYTAQRRAEATAAPVKYTYQQVRDNLLNGRDPCSVPRADPQTCRNGIPQATPLNSQP